MQSKITAKGVAVPIVPPNNHKCIFMTASLRCSLFVLKKEKTMETRVAVMGIIVENSGSVPTLNELLHEYADYIIGRMGLPYKKRGVSIVSIAIDAPQNVISALTGKIGRLDGVSVKTAYSNVIAYEE